MKKLLSIPLVTLVMASMANASERYLFSDLGPGAVVEVKSPIKVPAHADLLGFNGGGMRNNIHPFPFGEDLFWFGGECRINLSRSSRARVINPGRYIVIDYIVEKVTPGDYAYTHYVNIDSGIMESLECVGEGGNIYARNLRIQSPTLDRVRSALGEHISVSPVDEREP